MTCTHFERWIALDFGGDLDEARAGQLQAHLERCEGCRRFREELIVSQQALRSAHASFSQVLRGEDVRAEVLRRIEAEGLRPSQWPGWFLPAFGRWRYACAAGAVTVLAAGYAWLGSHPREQQRVAKVVAGEQRSEEGARREKVSEQEGHQAADPVMPPRPPEVAERTAREPDPALSRRFVARAAADADHDEQPSARPNRTGVAASDVASVETRPREMPEGPTEPQFEVVSVPSPGATDAEHQDVLIRVASQDSEIEVYWLIGENGA